MKHFFTLLRHEIRALLISPATYIATVLFLGLMGFVFQDLLVAFVREARDTAPAVDFFKLFWLPVFFLAPLLTMRCLAEERRLGTIETLMTTPVTTPEVVLSKFFAAYGFYLMLWLSTLSFHWVLYQFAENPQLIDPGPLIGGYLFVALSGLMFIAAGIFSSALTRSQLVAGLLTLAMSFVFTLGFRYLDDFSLFQSDPESLRSIIVDHVQIFQHAQDFVGGVFDTRAPVLYLSMTGILLFVAMLALDARSVRN
ncbi:MAG: ABC transporter permease [Opitutaceae bacterium]